MGVGNKLSGNEEISISVKGVVSFSSHTFGMGIIIIMIRHPSLSAEGDINKHKANSFDQRQRNCCYYWRS